MRFQLIAPSSGTVNDLNTLPQVMLTPRLVKTSFTFDISSSCSLLKPRLASELVVGLSPSRLASRLVKKEREVARRDCAFRSASGSSPRLLSQSMMPQCSLLAVLTLSLFILVIQLRQWVRWSYLSRVQPCTTAGTWSSLPVLTLLAVCYSLFQFAAVLLICLGCRSVQGYSSIGVPAFFIQSWLTSRKSAIFMGLAFWITYFSLPYLFSAQARFRPRLCGSFDFSLSSAFFCSSSASSDFVGWLWRGLSRKGARACFWLSFLEIQDCDLLLALAQLTRVRSQYLELTLDQCQSCSILSRFRSTLRACSALFITEQAQLPLLKASFTICSLLSWVQGLCFGTMNRFLGSAFSPGYYSPYPSFQIICSICYWIAPGARTQVSRFEREVAAVAVAVPGLSLSTLFLSVWGGSSGSTLSKAPLDSLIKPNYLREKALSRSAGGGMSWC